MTLNELNKLYLRKENYIDSKLKSLDKEVQHLQSKLLEIIMTDMAGKVQTEGGVIKVNEHNMRLATQVDGLMDKFASSFQRSVLKEFGNDMLRTTEFTMDYFGGMGYAESKLRSIKKGLGYISQRIGISDKGRILKGSYLDTLSKNAEVRTEIKNFILNNVAGQNDYSGYLRGLKELVVGNREVRGSLERYYRQYAYDSFNQVDATVNKHFADELNMKYFIYFGSVIQTTRPFCRKRAGKVFSVKETKKWKSDPDLIGKSKAGYNPLIDRGRYNCRHSIQYIPDEVACKKGKTEACDDS